MNKVSLWDIYQDMLDIPVNRAGVVVSKMTHRLMTVYYLGGKSEAMNPLACGFDISYSATVPDDVLMFFDMYTNQYMGSIEGGKNVVEEFMEKHSEACS